MEMDEWMDACMHMSEGELVGEGRGWMAFSWSFGRGALWGFGGIRNTASGRNGSCGLMGTYEWWAMMMNDGRTVLAVCNSRTHTTMNLTGSTAYSVRPLVRTAFDTRVVRNIEAREKEACPENNGSRSILCSYMYTFVRSVHHSVPFRTITRAVLPFGSLQYPSKHVHPL
jgi:hypothetical protein